MKRNYRRVILPGSMLIAIVSLISFLPNRWPLAPRVVLAASVAVTSTTDVIDGNTSSIANLIANPGPDGVISLREAITAANNTAGADTINIKPGKIDHRVVNVEQIVISITGAMITICPWTWRLHRAVQM